MRPTQAQGVCDEDLGGRPSLCVRGAIGERCGSCARAVEQDGKLLAESLRVRGACLACDLDRLPGEAPLVAGHELPHRVVPHLRRQKSGHFVQISSAAGQTGMAGGSIYHAGKWGVEGFFDSLHDELSPFGIGVTIVEPGAIASSFFSRVGVTTAIDAYESGPVGALRRYLSDADVVTGNSVGDPAKMAQAIIDSVSVPDPPQRLVLGSDAHTMIGEALTARLAAHEAQRELARTTDRTPLDSTVGAA